MISTSLIHIAVRGWVLWIRPGAKARATCQLWQLLNEEAKWLFSGLKVKLYIVVAPGKYSGKRPGLGRQEILFFFLCEGGKAGKHNLEMNC